MNETLLEVKDLHVSFKSHGQIVQAVRGVSLKIARGEKLAIVGESGCGKSVLVKALVGLLPAHTGSIDQGEIWYEGQNLCTFSEKELRRVRGREISMVFQDPMTSLNPTMKVGRQIAEMNPQCDPVQLLRRVGIPDPQQRVKEYPHTLSGGIRQRISIAIALAADAPLLIADEPTTALDVTVQAQILDLLGEIQKTMVLITHDLSVVAGFCDRIIVMYAGKIVEEGSACAVFSSPKHPYTQRLLQSIPRLDSPHGTPLVPIAGSPPDLAAPPKGCAFCARCSQAMNICRDQTPPAFSVGKAQSAACWLYDPRRAP